MIHAINNVNFQAKMDISKCEKYKYFWQEVANNFEKQTAKKGGCINMAYPNGMFSEQASFECRGVKNSLYKGKAFVYINGETLKKMTNDSPQNVAKKLSKMFDTATASAHKVADLWSKLYKNPPKKAQSSNEAWAEYANRKYHIPEEKISNKLEEKLYKKFDTTEDIIVSLYP